MNDPLRLLIRWIRRHWLVVGPVLLFVIAAGFLASLQWNKMFADPDSFYHVKLALLIRDNGIIHDFPWLAFTNFPERFVDQHFLYHVAMIPFVTWLPPLIGGKVATVTFSALFAVTFYLLLRGFRIRFAFVLTLLLLTVNPFTFRLSLTKAPGVSLILLFAILAALFHYRPRWVFALCFIYGWFYGGSPLALVVAGAFVAVSLVRHMISMHRDHDHRLRRLFASVSERVEWRHRRHLLWRLSAAAVTGVVLGLVINPYFPKNLSFAMDQLVRIGIINYQKVIGVGGEWYPYAFSELVPNTVTLSILLVISIVLAAVNARKLSARSWTLAVLTVFFLLLTLKSRRYIEYYVPVGMLFVGFALHDSLAGMKLRRYWEDFWHWALRSTAHLTAVVVLLLYVSAAFATIVTRDYLTEQADLRGGFRFDQYEGAMTWLANHSPADSLVFHSDWDEFPSLFYFNHHNRYIVGLDPTFFYTFDRERYWQWVDVTTGKAKPPLLPLLRDEFGAEYVFVDRNHNAMDALFRKSPDFPLVYSDSDAYIYKVGP
jgi:hypothetical protein